MTAIVLRGDARQLPLPDASVDLICTSPPYFGLRSYSDAGQHFESQIGSEATPGEWLAALLECTREWVRVLKPEGSIFVNLGDKYAGSRTDGSSGWHTYPLDRPKDGYSRPTHERLAASQGVLRTHADMPTKSLMGLPWRYALACTDQLGLILRAEIIWSKPNGLPESVTDRVRRSHEQVFHFTRLPRYYAAVDEIREPSEIVFRASQNGTAHHARAMAAAEGHHRYDMRTNNPLGKLPGSVWNIPSQPLQVPARLGVDHFAAFPSELPRRIIAGWSPPGICVACGQGRRPVVDKDLIPQRLNLKADNKQSRNKGNNFDWSGYEIVVGSTVATVTGYACACPDTTAPTRPSVVVDPFGGTGTTALVASVLGRLGVTFDLSADYCRLAAWRTTDPGERCRVIGAPKPPPVADGQGTLDLDLALFDALHLPDLPNI